MLNLPPPHMERARIVRRYVGSLKVGFYSEDPSTAPPKAIFQSAQFIPRRMTGNFTKGLIFCILQILLNINIVIYPHKVYLSVVFWKKSLEVVPVWFNSIGACSSIRYTIRTPTISTVPCTSIQSNSRIENNVHITLATVALHTWRKTALQKIQKFSSCFSQPE